jgi:hypothetical protein
MSDFRAESEKMYKFLLALLQGNGQDTVPPYPFEEWFNEFHENN